ncbi:MarR family winged helix-turn-helix transcriptional regulator [Oceanispirochaeta sp.]|jgi:MarR family 2-MHQ and catechol resistance regulon transcriptional repressor|uniref:MarR family winged helix-turn-helix transcriptional regulator n=1 Tax=Oceanispirochaeta sp. TaxID=2035350 RepID=UPI0026337FBB|nr:MarR family transcriptional regulator [Oceanispirochaeta sp.]MDA3956706.1 MarR family transcriptional regulator [Oceanispirochaeta sp.]
MKNVSYGNENDLNLKLVIALSRSIQHIRRGEGQNIQDAGLTLSQFAVLEALYHKGDLRICEIIEKTLSTGGNMTVVVNNLVKDGLVRRFKDPGDGRASRISLTEKGEVLIADLFPRHVESVQTLFERLESDEKRRLLDLLKKLTGKM